MSTVALAIAHVGDTLEAMLLAGLLVRGRVALCWSFFVYISATALASRLVVHWPEQFWTYTFYSMKETVLFALVVVVTLEIWLRTFSSFRRARVRVGLLLALALLATAVAALAIPPGLDSYDVLLGIVIPRQDAGVLMLCAIIASAVGWYRIPLHPLHRAILIGLGAYLMVNTLLMSVFAGWLVENVRAYRWCSAIIAGAYCTVSGWWAWVAWRPSREPSPAVSRLQPWAHSW
jgi:hypothetical protein